MEVESVVLIIAGSSLRIEGISNLQVLLHIVESIVCWIR
jgi:hypothetical protein